MFRKLIKYEIKSVGKWYFALYGAIMFCATILGLYISSFSTNSVFGRSIYTEGRELTTSEQIIMFAIILIFVSLIIGIGISTLFIIVNRFNKNVFGREGYLTLTLPVSTHQIILSKLLTSFLWSVLSAIILLFSFFLLIIPNVPLNELFLYLPNLIASIPIGRFLLLILYFITASIASILLIYFAISIGQLFQDKRALMGFVALFGIVILESVIEAIVFGNFNFTISASYQSDGINNYNSVISGFDPYIIKEIGVFLVQSAIYYFGTHYIIKNKLNIQ
ncbi:ABC transporter permease [Streptococcus zalophi]|uniref:ABC transporter permease n=1 Tax=Streptococcus zalophi TaxID=640031 RepID=UPI00215CE3A0|nr:ABC transporter permease [Streptococcus zalophi]MCR8967258.1 ABC transporter permease [Streptococcus zalophi]